MRRAGAYDACVIGGGPAGLAAAKVMADRGLGVAVVVEASSTAAPELHGQTLAASAGDTLTNLGLTEASWSRAVSPIVSVHATWGNDHPTSKTLLEAPQGLGWVVDRPAFTRALEAAVTAAGATVISAAEPRCTQVGDRWSIELDQAATPPITARCLVYATGRRGSLQPPGKRVALDQLVARIVVVPRRRDDTEARSIRIDALESGWAFSIAVDDDTRVVTYFTDGDLLSHGGHEDLVASARCLAKVVSRDQLATAHRVAVVSATTTFRRTAFGQRWIACGDAAQTVDPLSSRGIADALLDGSEAGQAVAAVLSGAPQAFAVRERQRRRRFAEYLRARAGHYRAEARWATYPFWSRRNNMQSASDFLLGRTPAGARHHGHRV